MRHSWMLALTTGLAVSACGEQEPTTKNPDVDGPSIALTSPPASGFAARSGSTLRVQGVVDDPSGVRSVTLNGHAVEPSSSGEFALDVDADLGVGTLLIEAEDQVGNVTVLRQDYLFGDFAAAPDDAGGQAAVVELAAPALDAFVVAISDVVASLPVEIPAFGQIAVDGDDLPLCDHLEIVSVGYLGAEVGLALYQDYVQISAALDTDEAHRLVVDFKAIDCTILGLDVVGSISAGTVSVQADTYLEATAGGFAVELRNATVELVDYNVELEEDVAGVLGDITQWLTEEAIVQAAAEAIDTRAGPLIQEQLDGLFSAYELMTLDTGAQTVALFLFVDPTTTGAGVSITPQGILLQLNAQISGWVVDAEGNPIEELPLVRDGLGSLLSLERDVGTDPISDTKLGASHDFINSILYAVWQWGLVQGSMDLGALGAVLGSELAEFETLRVEFESHLPPVVVPDENGEAPLELQLCDLDIRLYGTRTSVEGEELLAVLSTVVKVPVDFSLWSSSEETGVELDLGEPSIVMDVSAAPLGEEIADAFVSNVVALAPTLIDAFAGDLLRFALPALGEQPFPLSALDVTSEHGYLFFDTSLASSSP